MNFNNGDEASFFKVLRNKDEYLPLPSAFAKKYLEKGNCKKQTVFLKTKSGVKRPVRYLKIEDRYYFMGGWLMFMNENHLQIGDFLVFWLRSHHPNPTFEVFVYAPNGIGKHATSTDGTGSGNEEKTSHIKISLTRVIRKSYRYLMRLTKTFVNATGINCYSKLRLKNKEGKIWEVKLAKHRNGVRQVDVPVMNGGWVEFMRDNKVKEGDRCKFSHVKGNLLHVRVLKGKN